MQAPAWQESLLCGRASYSVLAFLRAGCVRKLYHPAPLTPRIVFLEPHALVTAREAVLDANDLELVFGDAHIDVAGPASAPRGILRLKIIRSEERRVGKE